MALNILDIKDYLWDICMTNVSDVVLASVPSIIPDSVNDFVVVSTPTNFRDITDYGECKYGQGLITITLFARDLEPPEFGGQENTALLGDLLNKLRYSVSTDANPSYRMIETGFREARNSYNGFHAIFVIYDLKTL